MVDHTSGSIEVAGTGQLLNTKIVNQSDGTPVHNEVIDHGNFISVNNSTTTVLGAHETWTGTGEDVSAYGRMGVSVWTPFGQPTSGTLTIEVSRDGVNWGGPSRAISDTTIAQPVMWEIVEQYIRLKYKNGATVPSAFVIQTQYSNNGAGVCRS